MIFEGNPGFIFHDSGGFEAGDAEELNLVQGFIEKRSRARNVNEQIHAIWWAMVCAFRKNKFLDAGDFFLCFE